ncbi:MAG: glycoside hydrolase family 127 protein [Bacteroidota bacterium]|nr:glycoside hydrolase family 127 protein [Odoribacter sp.]MDP3643842.1 glycoside hydrolase family 127 protein [Bacteroidota bacterium]
MKPLLSFTLIVVLSSTLVRSQESLQKLAPVNFSQVNITDPFWSGRMHAVATKTLDACILFSEVKTGRIRNFEKAAAHNGKHEGIYYDDSDVYKAIEAMAYSLKGNPNPLIEKKADEWIAKIAAAQMPDGYLNTYYELTDIKNRWTEIGKHEDYCAGHLIEAGIAYQEVTGKRILLDVAIRFANHIDSVMRKSNRQWFSGHQEIELALMKLYHHTNDRKYLELARWYLEQRGKGYGKGNFFNDPDYWQSGLPVKEQTQITGHAVRAMYLYTGAADVAAVTNDAGYIKAMQTIWEDVVYRNMYLTGGIGAEGTTEGFGIDYDLPNETAYCETCASVGMVFWNQRMNMLTGDAKFIDVLERSLYNGALDGLSLTGDRFFYGNPLASSGNDQRSEWFQTACCPSNIARLVSSVGNYIYSQSPNAVWINLYIGSEVKLPVEKQFLCLAMQTDFPWKGNTSIILTEAPKKAMQLKFRIPGWLKEPVPGGLYVYSDSRQNQTLQISVNGKPIAFSEELGYAVVNRQWKKGDIIGLNTPMEVRRIASRPELKQDNGRTALQYGPFVYCVEGADNNQQAWNFILPSNSGFAVNFEPDLLGGINTITMDAKLALPTADGQSIQIMDKPVIAIPYFVWNNRGASEMQVWLPNSFKDLKVNK